MTRSPFPYVCVLAAGLLVMSTHVTAAVAAAPGASARPAKARLNLDTPIKTLMADPRGRALLTRRMPGLTKPPASFVFRDKSLRQMSNDPHVGGLTPARLAEFERELAQIP